MWFVMPMVLGTAIPEFGVALAAFVIFEAAYFGEIVRAGIQSVARGQVEAGRALGLTGTQSMRFVVLPQALKNMIPSLVTQFIVLFKDTSLASIIGFMDLTKAPGREQPRDPPVPAHLLSPSSTGSARTRCRATPATWRRGSALPEVTLPTGVRLHWREAGDPASPAVVWIPGGSVEDSSVMLPDLEPVLPRIRAMFPDTRGHGLSQKFERAEDYTYSEKGRDLLLWLDGLGIGAHCGAERRWVGALALGGGASGAGRGPGLDRRAAVRPPECAAVL
jgi:hypothetical protein